MPINKEGVELLKADMLANSGAYFQDCFGEIIATYSECGTIQCMAGFCYLRKVGESLFKAALNPVYGDEFVFEDECVKSGIAQLGIKQKQEWYGVVPKIFCGASLWPVDLGNAYEDAVTGRERVEVACRALDRLNEDGSIKELHEI